MIENFARHITSHTANAATGIHSRGSTLAGELQRERDAADLGRQGHAG